MKDPHSNEFYERRLRALAPHWEEHLQEGRLVMALWNGLKNGERKTVSGLHKNAKPRRRRK